MATSVTSHFVFGTKDVAAAGTQVQLDATVTRMLRSLTIIAHSDNAGRVFYGGADVDSSTQKGLQGGESFTITGVVPFELGEIWIDAATNADGVDFFRVFA